MIIKNVKVYTEEKVFADGAVVIKDGRFDKVLTDGEDVQGAAGACAEEDVIDRRSVCDSGADRHSFPRV